MTSFLQAYGAVHSNLGIVSTFSRALGCKSFSTLMGFTKCVKRVQMYVMLSEATCKEVVGKMAHDKVELVE